MRQRDTLRSVREENRQSQITKNALGGATKDEIAQAGMAKATHRHELRALVQGTVLQGCSDGSAIESCLYCPGVEPAQC